MPAGALFSPGWKTTGQQMYRQKLIDWFTSKTSGNKWVVVKGGYKDLKQRRFGADNVNLQVRGLRGKGMLGSLAVIQKKENEIIIGFSNSEASQLAMYHEVLGAGKSRVKRQFMGISPAQQKELTNQIQDEIKKVVENGIQITLQN